ncbi:MAG: protein kinase, partial [Planctomycetes bacterium]|nr:protein kinase [Planctomycetota bacterium]
MTQPCPECGQPVRADQPLCAHCGRQLGGAGAPRGGEPSSGGRSAGGSPGDDASSIRRDKERDLAFLGKIVAGKYRVLKVLGQGGFGSVFLVEVVEGIVGDRLAIKILPQEFGSRLHLQEQFLNEIRVAMRMVNKYIVQIRDVGVTEEGLLYYTMDYVPGKTLSQIIREEGRIAPQRAIRIVMRVLNALMTAHSARIIHRDLKPANVMILGSGPRETVRVLDFGIARALVSEDRETKGFTGSPFYMPPEQFLGTELGFYTDLYSVGVILYECLTGEKPYRGSTPQDVYNSLKSGPPTPVEELAPEVRNFPGLAEVVARAMERNPEKRFQTAKEFFEVLHAVRSGEIDADTPTRPIAFPTPAKAAKPPAAPRIPKRRTVEKAKRTSRQSTLITIIILLGVIALAAILASEFLGKYREENREGGGKTAETSSAKGGLSQPGPTQPAP